MNISFQIVSDIHIEYNRSDNPLDYFIPSSDIIILAGDICSCNNFERFKNFMIKTCSLFKTVIFVSGNHEYYKYKSHTNFYDMKEINIKISQISLEVSNFFYLNQNRYDIGDYCIIGCTLWSHIEFDIPKFIVKIKDITTEKYNSMHNSDLNYIKKMIVCAQNENKKLIVITHYPPMKNNDKNIKFSQLYYNELEYLLKKEYIHTWIYGHTHVNYSFVTKEGTNVICNQKGKGLNTLKDYKSNFIIFI